MRTAEETGVLFSLTKKTFYKIKGNETRLALIVQVAVFDRFVWYRSQKVFAHSLILKRRMVWFCFFKVMHAYIGIPTKNIHYDMSLTISHFYTKILHFSANFSRKQFNFYWVQRILGKMRLMKA